MWRPRFLLPCVLAILSVAHGSAFADEATELYVAALESLVDGDETEAVRALQELVEGYPESPYVDRALELLSQYAGKLDHSGIVSFYLGNLASAVAIAELVPAILDVNDPIVAGGAGIVGLGGGLWSAWLMTRDNNMTWGQDLWIEFSEAAAITNLQFFFGLIDLDSLLPDYANKISLASQVVTVAASRAAAYFLVRNALPSEAKAGFVVQAYLWGHYYLWMTLLGIVQSEYGQINSLLGMLVPDLIAVGSYFLWDELDWSFARTGLVSVSGLGGVLLGGFVNLILSGLVNIEAPEVAAGILMGTALAGTAIGTYITSGMEPESEERYKTLGFYVAPQAATGGFELGYHWSY